VIDRLLFRPPTLVLDPARVGRLYYTREVAPGNVVTQGASSYPEYVNLSRSAGVGMSVAAYRVTPVSIGLAGDIRNAARAMVTSNYFAVLGISPAIGRFFRAEEDEPATRRRVAVVSYALWRQSFGSDPLLLGKTIQLN